MWAGFAVFVVVAIAVDLLVMERQGAHKVTMGEAARWSLTSPPTRCSSS